MDNRGIKAKRFCSILLGGQCGDWEEVNNWEINLPEGKPEPEEPVLPPVSGINLFLMYFQLIVFHC